VRSALDVAAKDRPPGAHDAVAEALTPKRRSWPASSRSAAQVFAYAKSVSEWRDVRDCAQAAETVAVVPRRLRVGLRA
jgi:hypothetical protein